MNLAHALPREEKKRMPLELKGILIKAGISQSEWADAITQQGLASGRRLSDTAATQILVWNQWPKTTSRAHIKQQTENLLRQYNVSESDIARCWNVDTEDRFHNKHRIGPRRRTQQTGNKKPRGNEASYDFSPETTIPETEMLSQNSRKHFRLFKDPFTDDVQSAEDVFLSSDQRYIREAMFTTAKHGGFLAVIGESGAGKSTLRRDLIDRVQREEQPITIIQPRTIDKGKLTAAAICDAIINDISQDKPRQSLEAKARQLEHLLIGSSRAGYAHALVIEEAHDLAVQTLKYLKRFWELEDGFRKLLAIILIGQPELKNKLDERQNWEAREVIRRCEIAELQPLNGSLEEYLSLKFKRVGRSLGDVFDDDAFDAIRSRLTLRRRGSDQTVSMHYPLVVNNLVTRACNVAAEIGAPKVSADIIKEV